MRMLGAPWVALLVVLASSAAYAERRLFIRDLPDKTLRCRNTVQGLQAVADDRGVVCKRSELSYATGCCAGGQQHDCSLCDLRDSCCSEYEACVACCLAPQHDAVNLAKRVLRSPRHKDSGFWGDPFEYCKGVCRTHSRSTAHENSYIGTRHHCFSQLGRPMLSDPLPPGALAGVDIVSAAPNATCDLTCSARRQTCSAPHLPHLNSCDRLRERHGCEAGCEVVAGLGPSYVNGDAPKLARPAMCFAQPAGAAVAAAGAGGKGGLSCANHEAHHSMLCPCV